MSNILVTTNQQVIEVTNVNGVTVTTPEGQTINVEVPNSSVNVTNTTDNITVLTSGTLNVQTGGITSVNGDTGPAVVLDTDDINEGSTNKYFTTSRARQSLSAGTGISYNTSTGVITNTSINTDTTYTIASNTTSGGANLTLTGSDSSTDSVAYKGAGATSVTSSDANTITITSTDTNTTYTQNASAATGGANLNLVGSDSTTDTIKFAQGTGITVTRTDADTITITNTVPDTNTTYTQNASSTTGGANLNLVGSDGSTDSVKFGGSGATTITRTDADTITVSSTDTNTTYSQNASATTGGANLNLVGSDSTTDTVKFAGSGATTITRTDADTITVSSTDTNTTYSQNASATTGGANLNLVGSDSTTDAVKFAGSGATTITRTDADTITVSSTDTNTTYSQNVSATTGGANLNLVGSDSTTDSVKFANGTGVTVTRTDADTATISIGQSVATTDNPVFAGGTFGNVTVGVDTDQTISTTSGNLILQTAQGTNAGTMTLTAGVNGNITLTPNGTGNLALTASNGGNLTNTRNYVFGGIRNSTTQSIGDMWALNSAVFASTGSSISGTTLTIGTLVSGTIAIGNTIAGPTVVNGTTITGNISGSGSGSTWTVSTSQTVTSSAINGVITPMRGITVDNSTDATKIPGQVIRSYNNTAGGRGRIVFERARFTGTTATPAAVQSGDFLGEIDVTGYTSTGWISDNVITGGAVPGFFGFTASENWVSNTNLGTAFTMTLAPTATTITSGASLVPTFSSQPENTLFRGDRFSISQGKTSTFTATGCSTSGSTLTIGTLVSGTIGIGNVLQVTGSANGYYIVANISGSGSGSTWTLSGSPGTLSGLSVIGNPGYMVGNITASSTVDLLQDLKLFTNNIKSSNGTTNITTGASAVTMAKPVTISGSSSGSVTLSAGATPAAQTYTLPAAYPSSNNQVLVSTTGGVTSWVNSQNIAANYLNANYTSAIGAQTANTIYGIPLTSVAATNITIATGTVPIDNATSTGPTRITIAQTGKYNLQFSIQLQNNDNAEQDFDIWLRKNGSDVADSNSQVSIIKSSGGHNGKLIIALNLLLDATANDYFELVYATTSSSVGIATIAAQSTPYVRPRTPGIIVTVVPVGA